MRDESNKPNYFKLSLRFLKILKNFMWLGQIGMGFQLNAMSKIELEAIPFITWVAVLLFNFYIIESINDLCAVVNGTNERLNKLEGKSKLEN